MCILLFIITVFGVGTAGSLLCGVGWLVSALMWLRTGNISMFLVSLIAALVCGLGLVKFKKLTGEALTSLSNYRERHPPIDHRSVR